MNPNTTILLTTLCFTISGLFGQAARLVKDITPGENSTFSSSFIPGYDGIKMSFDDKIIFITENLNGDQLWISNGEEEATSILHSIDNGIVFNNFLNDDENSIYYNVEEDDISHIYSLSKNTLDTVRLHSSSNDIRLMTYLNGSLYYKSDDDLMKLDPVSQAVELVYSFGAFRSIRDIGVLNDNLIIIGGESNGTELYISDGTTAGTQAFFQLNDGSEFSNNYYMTQVGDQLFFFYAKPSEPYVLYVTDGTTLGTTPLLNLENIAFVDLEKTKAIIAWDGKLFFSGHEQGDPNNADYLFVSDGTVSGSHKLTGGSEGFLKPANFTPYNGELYFFANYIFSVYKTDGTQAGTERAIFAGALGGGLDFGGHFLTEHLDSIYFTAYRSEVGFDLWVSEGTTESTSAVDVVPGEDDSNASQLTSTDNYLFLIYNSPEHGKELFVLDPVMVNTNNISETDISIYPNPFIGSINIDLGETLLENMKVKLIDMEGRIVFEKENPGQKVKLPSLSSGVYYLMIMGNDKIYSVKVVKV